MRCSTLSPCSTGTSTGAGINDKTIIVITRHQPVNRQIFRSIVGEVDVVIIQYSDGGMFLAVLTILYCFRLLKHTTFSIHNNE